jgi:hypothetical protein
MPPEEEKTQHFDLRPVPIDEICHYMTIDDNDPKLAAIKPPLMRKNSLAAS